MHAQKANGEKVSLPVVELKARPPVRSPQQSLQCTGKIYKHVAHQEEPEEIKQKEELIVRLTSFSGTKLAEQRACNSSHISTYMDRMGTTESREAMMIPISQMLAVSSRAHVGSPLALP